MLIVSNEHNRWSRTVLGCALAAPALLLITSVLHAQLATTDILGTVTGAFWAVIPNANVMLVNNGTHEKRTAAQLRVLLRAIVNLDPYTFADDLAVEINGDDQNDRRSAEEVLLSAIDSTGDGELTRFAIRLAPFGHLGIPREGEPDLLAEAEQAFGPAKPERKASRKKKEKPASVTKRKAQRAKRVEAA